MGYAIYKLTRISLRCLYRLTGGLEVRGSENTPPKGPLIVAVNHSSFWDPMIMGAAFDRPLHFMARKSLFDIPIFGWLIKQTLAFPLNREGDSREAIRSFGNLLEKNEAVLIFPEGTRSHDGLLGNIKPGVGMIAARYNVPVLPVYIWGSFQSWPRTRTFPRPHHLKVLIAPPVQPPQEGSDRKDEQRRIVAEVGASLHQLQRDAWQGEDSPPAGLLPG